MIIVACILAFFGMIGGGLYTIHRAAFKEWFSARKEYLLIVMNQGTMLLVMSQLIVALGGAHRFQGGSDYVSLVSQYDFEL